MITLTGVVTYVERVALPASAVVEVQLLDVSKADAPAETMSSQTIATEGRNVPIPFALTYDPRAILPNHRYVVSARITVDGQVQWRTTAAHPVLTNGQPSGDVTVRVTQSR